MRYNKDSYEEISKEQAQKFFEVIKVMLSEIDNGGTKGRVYNDFIKAGVEPETMSMLKAGFFITWHDKNNTPVWIAWTNPLHEERTISDLKFFFEHYCNYDLSLDLTLEIK